MPTDYAATVRFSNSFKNGVQIDVAEDHVRLDTMNSDATVKLPRFKKPPEITLTPYSRPTFDETAPTPEPEILNVTKDSFALKIHTNTSAGLWKWRATGTLQHPAPQNLTAPPQSSSVTGEKKWSRGDKIAAVSLVVTILLAGIAFIAAVAVPELRVWLHLDRAKPPEITAPSSTK